MKKKAAILLTLLLICVIPAFAAESLPESTEEVIENPEEICTYIDKIDEFGNLELGISPLNFIIWDLTWVTSSLFP